MGYQNGHFTERLRNMELNHKSSVRLTASSSIVLILIAVIGLFSGCKVTYSFTGAHTQGLKTFNVVYFQNRAPIVQAGFSQILTDALIDKCKAQTSMKYVTDIGDASFEGEITDYNTRPLTVGADALAATNRFTISVKVKFTNAIDPSRSFEKSFSGYKDYSSNQDLNSVEKDLSDQIIEILVEDIFNQAFVNW